MDTYRKQYVIDDELAVLDILDPAVQEDNGQRAKQTYCMRKADGVLLAYTIRSRHSFEVIMSFYEELLRIKGRNSFPIVLVACQSDAPQYEREVSIDEGRQLAKDLGCPFHETSATQRINVDEAFNDLMTGTALRDYKLVVVGGVGRSALTVQFLQNRSVDDSDVQMYIEYSRKQCVIDDMVAILDILDVAEPNEYYRAIREQYIHMGDGVLLVYSITSRDSFEKIVTLHPEILRSKDHDSFPVILVANKLDVEYER
ncbi:hypothetical protein DXG01_014226 [Tephrocybe rancida]|nr:hypothetical protein DXG01_014226 [Tephrocybe rancida]